MVTLHNQLLAIGLFGVGAAAQGELRHFSHRLVAQSRPFQLGFLASIVLGLLINFSSFWCLSVTSGTTYSFVGASNKIPAAILGHYFFDSGLNALGWLGIGFGLSAGLLYALSKRRLPARNVSVKSQSQSQSLEHAHCSASVRDDRRHESAA